MCTARQRRIWRHCVRGKMHKCDDHSAYFVYKMPFTGSSTGNLQKKGTNVFKMNVLAADEFIFSQFVFFFFWNKRTMYHSSLPNLLIIQKIYRYLLLCVCLLFFVFVIFHIYFEFVKRCKQKQKKIKSKKKYTFKSRFADMC